MTEKFHYQYDGDNIVIPHVKQLPTGVLRRARKLEGIDQAFTILEDIAADHIDVIDRMPLSDLEQFLSAWQEASGVSLGESVASST